MNGTISAGSGNQWHRKNDVRNETYSIECKTTKYNQYTLKRKELEEAEYHALCDGRDSLFIVEMNGREWVIQPKEDWLRLEEEAHGDGS